MIARPARDWHVTAAEPSGGVLPVQLSTPRAETQHVLTDGRYLRRVDVLRPDADAEEPRRDAPQDRE